MQLVPLRSYLGAGTPSLAERRELLELRVESLVALRSRLGGLQEDLVVSGEDAMVQVTHFDENHGQALSLRRQGLYPREAALDSLLLLVSPIEARVAVVQVGVDDAQGYGSHSQHACHTALPRRLSLELVVPQCVDDSAGGGHRAQRADGDRLRPREDEERHVRVPVLRQPQLEAFRQRLAQGAAPLLQLLRAELLDAEDEDVRGRLPDGAPKPGELLGPGSFLRARLVAHVPGASHYGEPARGRHRRY
mmetsp:Transcript_29617/g.78429  ORF Transcript_29617/g.78429 Transcript_29617/m.78429 type:complete len:249 (-) Transcript_29617:94-840(-)